MNEYKNGQKKDSPKKGSKDHKNKPGVGDILNAAGTAAGATGKAIQLYAPKAGTSLVVAGKTLKAMGTISHTLSNVTGKKWLNHPDWHTLLVQPGDVGVNTAYRRSNYLPTNDWYDARDPADGDASNYNFGQCSAPLVAGYLLDLVSPKSITDDRTWQQAFQLIRSNLRLVNTGASRYSPVEIEHFILSLRSLHAMVALADKYVRIVQSIDPSDAETPRSYVVASGFRWVDDEVNDISNISARVSRWKQMIDKLYPYDNYLLARTRELMGTVFIDETQAKGIPYVYGLSNLYIPTADGGLSWRNVSFNPGIAIRPDFFATAYNTKATDMIDQTNIPFSHLAGLIDTAFKNMAAFNPYSDLAADLQKAYGVAIIKWPDHAIGEYIYDEMNIRQLHNADVMNMTINNDPTNDIKPDEWTTEHAYFFRWKEGSDWKSHSYQGYPYSVSWLGKASNLTTTMTNFYRSIMTSAARKIVAKSERVMDYGDAEPSAGLVLEGSAFTVTALGVGSAEDLDWSDPTQYAPYIAADIVGCGTEIVAAGFVVARVKADDLGAIAWFTQTTNNLVCIPIGYGVEGVDTSYIGGSGDWYMPLSHALGHYATNLVASLNSAPRHQLFNWEADPDDDTFSYKQLAQIWDDDEFALVSANNLSSFHTLSSCSLVLGPNTRFGKG